MTDAERRIRRAVHTATDYARSSLAVSLPSVHNVKARRFHEAMDALEPGEGEEVYRRLSKEPWYAAARKLIAPPKKNSRAHGYEYKHEYPATAEEALARPLPYVTNNSGGVT